MKVKKSPFFTLSQSFFKGTLIGASVIFLVVILWLVSGFRASSGSVQHFSIPKGQPRMVIAQRLEDAGIIRSSTHFLILSYLQRRVILAGEFTLDPTVSLPTILGTLSSEEKRHQVITIPEGWRREQIADYLSAKGVNKDEFLRLTEGQEGKLFPDTYYIESKPTAVDVVSKFTQNFAAKTASLGVTTDQLILASIVEREAKRDDERPLIAGVYMNRLNRGMRLEADPTVQYGRDTNLIEAETPLKEYWQSITVADYQGVHSVYNTYLRTGLPPHPIANPGLKSIHAAQNPEATSAFFFFHTADGRIITSRTLEEHTRNKRTYL